VSFAVVPEENRMFLTPPVVPCGLIVVALTVEASVSFTPFW
jgi:hypothetical protein